MALVRRGIPIDHPIPEVEERPAEQESIAETQDTVYETADEYESDVYESAAKDDADMPPPIKKVGVAGTSGEPEAVPAVKGGKALKRHGTGDSGIGHTELPGTAKDQGGGGPQEGTGPMTKLPRPSMDIHSYVRHYRKVHRFISWGIAYHMIEKTFGTAPNQQIVRFITTPFVNIPWDRPYLYLNQCEYEQLPPGSYCESVKCEVKSRNVRVAFPTNSSSSQLATLNQVKDICYAVGLNQRAKTLNAQYIAFETDQNMIPTDFEFEDNEKHTDLRKDLYGLDFDDPLNTVPRHQVGIPTPLPTYALLTMPKITPYPGYPCLQAMYHDFDADTQIGNTLVSVNYQPKIGMLKEAVQSVYTGYPQANGGAVNLATAFNTDPKFSKFVINTGTTGEVTSVARTAVDIQESTVGTNKISDIDPIEKCQWYGYEWDVTRSWGNVQPSLHVAVQPSPALDTKALGGQSNSNFTDTQGYWEVICDMSVNTQAPAFYPRMLTPNVTEEGIRIKTSVKPNPYMSTYNGLFRSS